MILSLLPLQTAVQQPSTFYNVSALINVISAFIDTYSVLYLGWYFLVAFLYRVDTCKGGQAGVLTEQVHAA